MSCYFYSKCCRYYCSCVSCWFIARIVAIVVGVELVLPVAPVLGGEKVVVLAFPRIFVVVATLVCSSTVTPSQSTRSVGRSGTDCRLLSFRLPRPSRLCVCSTVISAACAVGVFHAGSPPSIRFVACLVVRCLWFVGSLVRCIHVRCLHGRWVRLLVGSLVHSLVRCLHVHFEQFCRRHAVAPLACFCCLALSRLHLPFHGCLFLLLCRLCLVWFFVLFPLLLSCLAPGGLWFCVVLALPVFRQNLTFVTPLTSLCRFVVVVV